MDSFKSVAEKSNKALLSLHKGTQWSADMNGREFTKI